MGILWWLMTGNPGMLAIPEGGTNDKTPSKPTAQKAAKTIVRRRAESQTDSSEPLAMARYAEQTIANRYRVK